MDPYVWKNVRLKCTTGSIMQLNRPQLKCTLSVQYHHNCSNCKIKRDPEY